MEFVKKPIQCCNESSETAVRQEGYFAANLVNNIS
jgi:hypothetical protein